MAALDKHPFRVRKVSDKPALHTALPWGLTFLIFLLSTSRTKTEEYALYSHEILEIPWIDPLHPFLESLMSTEQQITYICVREIKRISNYYKIENHDYVQRPRWFRKTPTWDNSQNLCQGKGRTYVVGFVFQFEWSSFLCSSQGNEE